MTAIFTRDNEYAGSAQPAFGGPEPGAGKLARRVPRGVQGWQHPCAYLTVRLDAASAKGVVLQCTMS